MNATDRHATTIRVVTVLHPAIDGEERDRLAEPIDFPATEANLAYCLDMAARRRLINVGCYGGIGAGSTSVLLITNDQEEFVVDDGDEFPAREADEGEQLSALIEAMPRGELPRARVQALAGPVWDGDNHVEFVPVRAEEFCDQPDTEDYPWGTVIYSLEEDSNDGWRCVNAVNPKGGWQPIYWADGSGRDPSSLLTTEEWELLESGDLPNCPSYATFADAPNELVVGLCRTDDLDAIRSAVRAAADAAD